MKRYTIGLITLLLIVGCSKPVEDSTLINKDGLTYLPDSDLPYSGEVFTNYDTGEKEYQGTYENGLLVKYSYLDKDGSVKEPVNGEILIKRSGLLYEVNGQKPYTGDLFELYDDGSRKHSGSLKGGKEDRLWTKWYDNGQKEEELTFKDGKMDGLTTGWYKNGQKESEGTYKDDKLDGLKTRWHENGQKESEGTYKDGKMDGLTTGWYKNGQKEGEGAYKDGKKDGWWTFWDENGNKVEEGTYINGNLYNINYRDVAVISTQFGDMVVEFYPDVAPRHVESFTILAKEGYFDGTTFHRLIPGFVIQGGDPNSKDEDRMNDGSGGRAGKYYGIGRENNRNTWLIPGEFNDKLHVRGTLSMARTRDPNSASSQFFICHAATPQLDNQYTVFAQVIKGLEVIDKIVNENRPKKENPSYQGPDGDNPYEKIEMTVKIMKYSEAIII